MLHKRFFNIMGIIFLTSCLFFSFFSFSYANDLEIKEIEKKCLEEEAVKPHLVADEYRCFDEAKKIYESQQKTTGSGVVTYTESVNIAGNETKESLKKKSQSELADICSRNLKVKENGGLVGYDGGICKEYEGGNMESGFEVVTTTVQRLLDWVVGIAYLLAVLAIFFGGFKLIIANGNPTEMGKAKDILVAVLKGLFVITAAWMIVDFIFALFINESDIDRYKFTNQSKTL
jgi:hypothetical protein